MQQGTEQTNLDKPYNLTVEIREVRKEHPLSKLPEYATARKIAAEHLEGERHVDETGRWLEGHQEDISEVVGATIGIDVRTMDHLLMIEEMLNGEQQIDCRVNIKIRYSDGFENFIGPVESSGLSVYFLYKR